VELGYTSYWPPPDDDGRTPIYGLVSYVKTKNIVGFIDNYCKSTTGVCEEKYFAQNGVSGATSECDLDGGGVTIERLDSLDLRLIKHVIAHEVGHNIKLTYKKSHTYGWHYKPQVNVYKIMENNIDVKQDGDDHIFHIPDYFSDESRIARRLWE